MSRRKAWLYIEKRYRNLSSLLFLLKLAHYCINLQIILHKMCNFYIKTRILYPQTGANQEQTSGSGLGAVFSLVFCQIN